MRTRITSLFPRAAMALLLTLLTSLSAWAVDVTVNGIRYSLDDEKATAVVAELTDKSLASVAIPTSVERDSKTYTVTAIGNAAFYECANLVSVSFANDSKLTTIGDDAFSNCTKLASITIPEGVTSIGYSAFHGTNLRTITIPANVTSIDGRAFRACENLADVLFADGSQLTSIGEDAFYGTCVTDITIPASVTTIGESAFDNCKNLGTVGFGEGTLLTTIGDYAFNQCTNLSNITIPAGVTSIGSYAFRGTKVSAITIPANVTSIGESAFYECASLQNLTFANGSRLTSIGNDAFYECKLLESITIPAGVTSLGTRTFSGCANLGTVSFANGSLLTTIGDEAFWGCTNLSNIDIPDGVTSIGNDAFNGCTSVTHIDIPNVTSIGNKAFYGCVNLEMVGFGADPQLTTIGGEAFFGCSKLERFIIGRSVTTIGEGAFSDCSALTDITVDTDNAAFMADYGVLFSKDGTTLHTYPKGLTATIYDIPDVVTTICGYAFYNCDKLATITIPASVTSIGGAAFEGTTWIANQAYDGGVLYVNYIALASSGDIKDEVAIKDGTTTIAANCFNSRSDVTAVIIPASVTSIGESAFSNCSNLSAILVQPVTPPTLGSGAFVDIVRDATFTVANTSYKTAWSDVWGNTGDYEWYWFKVVVPGGAPQEVAYIDATGQPATSPAATPITSTNVDEEFDCDGGTWYYVSGDVTIDGGLRFKGYEGTANLILCDGATLTVDSLSAENNLNIYQQEKVKAVGTMTVTNSEDISMSIFVKNDITINGGIITCNNTGDSSFGIFALKNITINGGTIDVTADAEGIFAEDDNITINGGTITVKGAEYGIDSGDCLTVNGGTVTVKDCETAVFSTYTILINGGRVVANGSDFGMYAYNDIILGWTNTDDYIYASSYVSEHATVSITDGQKLSYDDGAGVVSGNNVNPNNIAGKYLYPVADAVTITMNASGIRTFACAQNLQVYGVEGLTAYIVSGFDGTNGTLTLDPITRVPAGTGVLLKGTPNETFTVSKLSMPLSPIQENYLVGVLNDETVVSKTEEKSGEQYTNFILANGTYGIDWYTLSAAGPIGANKAYLSLPTDQLPSSGSRFTWVYGEETTTSLTPLDNLTISPVDNSIYDLSGRKVSDCKLSNGQMPKGVYIHGGKVLLVP